MSCVKSVHVSFTRRSSTDENKVFEGRCLYYPRLVFSKMSNVCFASWGRFRVLPLFRFFVLGLLFPLAVSASRFLREKEGYVDVDFVLVKVH